MHSVPSLHLLEGSSVEGGHDEITSRRRHDLKIPLPASPNQISLAGLFTPTLSWADRTIWIDLGECLTAGHLIHARCVIHDTQPHIFAPDGSHRHSGINAVSRVVERLCWNDCTLKSRESLERTVHRKSEVLETINDARVILDITHTERRNSKHVGIATSRAIHSTHTHDDIIHRVIRRSHAVGVIIPTLGTCQRNSITSRIVRSIANHISRGTLMVKKQRAHNQSGGIPFRIKLKIATKGRIC